MRHRYLWRWILRSGLTGAPHPGRAVVSLVPAPKPAVERPVGVGVKSRYAKAGAGAVALILVVVANLGLVDKPGEAYTEEGLQRALLTFGVVRGLNAVISVAQGTEIAVEPVGVGMTFTPGEILDPVNDLIERFSWVVLASGTSLGIQRVLLDVTAWVWFTVLVTVSVLAAAAVALWPRPVRPGLRRGVYRLAAVLVLLRFAVPLIAICSEGLYQVFLAPQYEDSSQALEKTAESISEINEESRQSPPEDGETSILMSIKRVYESATGVLEVEDRIEAFKEAAAEVSEHALNLIVVFVMQTILFPLVFLWLVVVAIKRLAAL